MANVINVIGNSGSGSGYRQAASNMMKCFSDSFFECNYYLTSGEIAPVKYKQSRKKADVNFFISAPPYANYQACYNIGYFYWEADTFPISWERGLRSLNEIWAPCNLVAECARKMNFSGKIKIVPTPMRNMEKSKKMINFNMNNLVISEKCFKFYSIFQWQYRKGFDVLLYSYLKTFSSKDDVVLILKINPLNKVNFKDEVNNAIKKIKKKVGIKKFPAILIVDNYVDNQTIDAIHRFSDCFVIPHRGEGWGMPIARAIMHDNHVITTQYGGVTDYLDHNCSNIISHSMTAVSNMEWCPLYNGGQSWAEPDPESLSLHMNNLYKNEKNYIYKILNANSIKDKFSMSAFKQTIERELVKI